MIDIQHDIGLLIGSVLSALVACYLIARIKKFASGASQPNFKTFNLMLTAMLLGLFIWLIHFIGLTASFVLNKYELDWGMLLLSVLVICIASMFILWLSTRSTWSFFRSVLVLGVIALSIFGMHSISMMSFNFTAAHMQQSPELVQAHDQLFLAMILMSGLLLVTLMCIIVSELRVGLRNRQLAWANQQIENQTIQDNLTKLPNRLYLAEYANLLFSGQSEQQHEIAFLYIDLDRFKAVNDVFGHLVGDQLLIQLTTRIHLLLGHHSKLLRIGGDEFLLVLENTSVAKAAKMSEQILELIQESFLIEGKSIHISGSIGIAMYPEHGKNLQDLLVNADAAMLSSKYQGRNTYSVFNYSTDQDESKSQSTLINDLYKAVEEQQFVLFYQPKFRTKDRSLCGVEALIRWNHPQFGLLGPNLFINAAEKTGLIIQMGYWALELACQQIQKWQRTHTEFFPIAVNLSAVQFEHKHLFSTLEKLFAQYKISPQHLMIEITESTAMHHIDVSMRSFKRLRQMGIRLAIDDFGTGHSSFLYLKNFAVDELKIDREFIKNLAVGSKEEMILESIIQLAIKLGLVVTAEGVETEAQAEILTRLGCEQLQGFLLGLPGDEQRLENLQFHE
ncbi:putative bifunctional diguanylate cyclase/phosphodiesterase [Acinetobacter lwoffii]|uniref:Diguanylate cyclase (GGDEF)-like protein n=1 Tax=Acinetobacter lwoffii TaxID=28090 RepID=A0AAW3VDV3_ACILW|nr:EAL domain-containing protein [Acinetobacter lwoffii]MBB6362775.1 diguanylate cyclase (GGDEF)-like protein [Acinetobacter lwoffii]